MAHGKDEEERRGGGIWPVERPEGRKGPSKKADGASRGVALLTQSGIYAYRLRRRTRVRPGIRVLMSILITKDFLLCKKDHAIKPWAKLRLTRSQVFGADFAANFDSSDAAIR